MNKRAVIEILHGVPAIFDAKMHETFGRVSFGFLPSINYLEVIILAEWDYDDDEGEAYISEVIMSVLFCMN